MTTTEYQVTGMTCEHCERSVTEEVTQIDGIDAIDVSAVTGKMILTSSADVDDAKVLAAVSEAGYEAVRS